MEKYLVTIELQTIQLNVSAKSVSEAKRKALLRLNKKKPDQLIDTNWPRKSKKISVDKW